MGAGLEYRPPTDPVGGQVASARGRYPREYGRGWVEGYPRAASNRVEPVPGAPVTEPISIPWVDRPLAAIGEEQHVDEDDSRDEKRTIQSGSGMTPTAPWIRSRRAASRVDV